MLIGRLIVMNEYDLPQISRLLQDASVETTMKILSPTEYQNAIIWIRDHFIFVYGQQIDWSNDPSAVAGNIAELTGEKVLELLRAYSVKPSRYITILWAYGDSGISLPLYLAAKHIKDIWLPVLDDVFLFDSQDTWCMELYHEGNFSCGRYR